MKAASLQEIKQELKELPPARLAELCLRLAKFKKDNKELLSFLLFEADDLERYIAQVQEEIDAEFEDLNLANLFFVKKSLRRILRLTNKHIRYTGSKEAEAALRIHFLERMKELDLPLHRATVLTNLYAGQLKKIRTAISALHEDLQHDYERKFEDLK